MNYAVCQRMDSVHLTFQDLKETVASEFDRLETELAEARREIVRLEDQMERVEQENAELRDQVDELRAALTTDNAR